MPDAPPGSPAPSSPRPAERTTFRGMDIRPLLFDERTDPDFRAVFGRLCSNATEVDVALTHLRLSTLDFDAAELAGVRRIRLLLARVNAVALDVEAHHLMAAGPRGDALRRLGDMLGRGAIEIRSSPLAGWSPDFTVFTSERGPAAVLLGCHWFQRPFPHRGPAFASLYGPDEAGRARARFSEVWGAAHDISPAIRGILLRSEWEASGSGRSRHPLPR